MRVSSARIFVTIVLVVFAAASTTTAKSAASGDTGNSIAVDVAAAPAWRHTVKVDSGSSSNNAPLPPTYTDEFLAEANDYNITNRVVDIFVFTQYCGPSSRLSERVVGGRGGRRRYRAIGPLGGRVTYAELDVCCRQHDNCPNYITQPAHYAQYPGLERRNQYFARMQCTCDGLFYRCLSDLQSRYASAVAIGYGIVQSYCFDFEHPIVRCARRSMWRCEAYVVDATQPKRWQWFDVPPAYKKIFVIPSTVNGTV